ncbi:hypothetical protein GGR57DRAFT_477551 [Xylariaceae sp. FL1272]|nr:hypothetical protein GGR57DRAFT_477551 [Xylariaceae sp. FL1272]
MPGGDMPTYLSTFFWGPQGPAGGNHHSQRVVPPGPMDHLLWAQTHPNHPALAAPGPMGPPGERSAPRGVASAGPSSIPGQAPFPALPRIILGQAPVPISARALGPIGAAPAPGPGPGPGPGPSSTTGQAPFPPAPGLAPAPFGAPGPAPALAPAPFGAPGIANPFNAPFPHANPISAPANAFSNNAAPFAAMGPSDDPFGEPLPMGGNESNNNPGPFPNMNPTSTPANPFDNNAAPMAGMYSSPSGNPFDQPLPMGDDPFDELLQMGDALFDEPLPMGGNESNNTAAPFHNMNPTSTPANPFDNNAAPMAGMYSSPSGNPFDEPLPFTPERPPSIFDQISYGSPSPFPNTDVSGLTDPMITSGNPYVPGSASNAPNPMMTVNDPFWGASPEGDDGDGFSYPPPNLGPN